MGTPIDVDESQRSLYVRALPRIRSLGPSEYDATIEVFLPSESCHRIDNDVVEQVTKQAKHWGFDVHEKVERLVHESGHGPCVKYTLYLSETEPESPKNIGERQYEYVLQQIVQASMVASGSAHIEEFTLDGRHIATQVTLMVTEGALDEPNFTVLRETEDIQVEKIADGEYLLSVRVTPDLEDSIYDPVATASFTAQWMGLFLIMPIEEPTRTPLYRTPDVVEAPM